MLCYFIIFNYTACSKEKNVKYILKEYIEKFLIMIHNLLLKQINHQ